MAFDSASIQAPFRMQPGLRRILPGASPLRAVEPGGAVFTEKLAVLARHAREALVAVPGFDAAPALQALVRQAVAGCPHDLQCAGPEWLAPRLGLAVAPAEGRLRALGEARADVAAVLQALPPPWRATGLLALVLHADLAIVDGSGATVPWMAVCLPSHWSPREKVGAHFSTIHAPVADNALLLAAGPHLMRLVCQDQRWERFVWTLTPNPAHDRHPGRERRVAWPADAGPAALARLAWLRTEHQTFIPVPGRQQAVFTIEVDMQPLCGAVARADDAVRLHAALASMSPAVLAYRGLAPARDRLLAWLSGVAADASAGGALPDGPAQDAAVPADAARHRPGGAP